MSPLYLHGGRQGMKLIESIADKVRDLIYPYEKIALIIYKHSRRRNKTYYEYNELFNLLMRETSLKPTTILMKIRKLVQLGWLKPVYNTNPLFPNSRLISGYRVQLRLIEYELKRRGWIR